MEINFRISISDASKFDAFRFEESGFSFENQTYSFDDVQRLWFYRIALRKAINGIPYETSDSATLRIYLGEKGEIPLGAWIKPAIKNLFVDKKKEMNKLYEIYALLSHKTYQNRLAKYIQQIKEQGYFEYENCQFHPREMKIVVNNVDYYVSSTTFLKSPFHIELKTENPGDGILKKIAKKFSFNSVSIATCTDTDVIFSLLDAHFGLRWKDF